MSEGESRNGGCLSALFGGLFRPSQADIARAQAYESRAHALEIAQANRVYTIAIAHGMAHSNEFHPALFPTYMAAQVQGWMDAVGYEHFPDIHYVRLGDNWDIQVRGFEEGQQTFYREFIDMTTVIAEQYPAFE